MFNYAFAEVLSFDAQKDTTSFKQHVDSIPALSEIIIQSDKKKIIRKNDTTTFFVSNYLTGAEKKVEEVLIKIPGITINPDNGMISYYGRTVESVKIDGADLLGANYSVGTRNIPAHLINEIQAIENDPKNPLLKQFGQQGRMVLNLKTKKNTGAINGSLEFGSGLMYPSKTPADLQLNSLGLFDRYKSFIVSGYNNRGINNGSFNYFQHTDRPDTYDQNQYRLNNLIDPLQSLLPVEHSRYHINQTRMLNGNFLMHTGKNNQSIRLNLYLLRDHIFSGYKQSTRFTSAADLLYTSDQMTVDNEPQHIQLEVEYRQLLTKNLWIEYIAEFQKQQITSNYSQIMNEEIPYHGFMRSGNVYHSHRIDLTRVLSRQSVFRSIFTGAYHQLKEALRVNHLPMEMSQMIQQKQDIHSRKSTVGYQGIITIKKGSYQYDAETGFFISDLPFTSAFYIIKDSGTTSDPMLNDQQQRQKRIYQSVSVIIRKDKYLIQPKLSLNFHHFSYGVALYSMSHTSFFRLEPSIVITRKINASLKWVNTFRLGNQPLSETPYFNQAVLISPRNRLIHSITPDLQKSYLLHSFLVCQNLFNQLTAQFDIQLFRNDKSNVSDLAIEDRFVISRSEIIIRPQHKAQIGGQLEKFIPKMKSTLSADFFFTASDYFNRINSKNIRRNESQNFIAGFHWRTSLRIPFNAAYKLKLNEQIVQSDERHLLRNRQIHHSFLLSLKCKKVFFMQISADLYQLKSGSYNSILFLDALMRYKPSGKKYGFTMTAKNLLNHQSFLQEQVADYGRVATRTNLLPGYLMLQWEYRF